MGHKLVSTCILIEATKGPSYESLEIQGLGFDSLMLHIYRKEKIMLNESFIVRTDGKSLCEDCIYYGGVYIGCLISTNTSSDNYKQSCNMYTKRTTKKERNQ